MADVNDYGIKITKPGFDVATAGDADLIFSSSWPSLPIVTETTIGSLSSFNGGSFTHGVGFAPFTQVWRTRAGATQRTGLNNGALSGVDDTDIVIDSGNISLTALDPFQLSAELVYNYHIKCYNIDLSVEKEYPILTDQTTQASTSRDYGIKVVKEDEDIDSTDMRDFILHSRCQSPLILAVKTQESASGTTVSYTETIGYRSWVFGYVRDSNNAYRFAPYFAQAYPITSITSSGGVYTYSVQYLAAAGDTGASLVILRDPMFAATNVEASY